MNKYRLIFQIAFILILTSAFFACKQENDVLLQENENSFSQTEQALVLKAPSGQLIASSISELKEETAKIVGERFGVDKKFNIVAVNYLEEVKEGYVAFVEYETEDGICGNYAKSNNLNLKFNANQVIMSFSPLTKIKSGSESGSEEREIKMYCVTKNNCTQSQCTLEGETEGGVPTVWCNCAECALKIEQ